MSLSKNLRLLTISLCCFFFSIFFYAGKSEAATYTWQTGVGLPSAGCTLTTLNITMIGWNTTHGVEVPLPYYVSYYFPGGGGSTAYVVNYILPDDGCTWNILGAIDTTFNNTSYNYHYSNSYSATKITGGSFTGPSAGTATTAANNANTAAQGAQTAALNASTYAQQANTNASNASNRAWYSGTYGGSQQSVADVSGYIAYNQLPSINTKIDGLQSSITNIQNNLGSDITPPVVSIRTVSGAWGTSGSSIRAVVNASDNVSTAFEYSLDGTAYQPLPADGVINLPVNLPGNNLITVWVKDEAGNTGRNSITIRKL